MLNIKNRGIIISYTWLIVSIYLFDWDSFNVFITYLLEYLVLALIFIVSDVIVNNTIEKQAKRQTVNIFMSLLIFAGFQYFIAAIVHSSVRDDMSLFDDPIKYLNWSTYITAGCILVSYLIRIKQLKETNNIHQVIEDNFILQILGIAVMNMVGLGAVALFGVEKAPILLTIIILGRIGLEVYISKNIKML